MGRQIAKVLVHLERKGACPAAVFVLAPDEATAQAWLDEDRYGLVERGFEVVGTYGLGLKGGRATLPTGLWETATDIYKR